MSNGENWITDRDRDLADAVAAQYGIEPNYEHTAALRRETERMKPENMARERERLGIEIDDDDEDEDDG